MKILSLEYLVLELIILLIFFGSIKKEKLTLGGGLSALLVGSLVSLGGFEYLLIMSSFFFSSIKATDLHVKIKTSLLGSSYFKDKKRSASQVLAKGLFPSFICLLIHIYFVNKKNGNENVYNTNNEFFEILLNGIFIGFFESANADTWASELGIASSSPPIHLLSGGKSVPKGVNGAISGFGTFCSVIGGAFIGLMTGMSFGLRIGIINIIKNEGKKFGIFLFKLLISGSVIGAIGSFIDSLLGETTQLTVYNESKKCVVEKGEEENSSIKNGDKIKYYGRDILSNSQINLITGVITSMIAGYVFTKIF